MPRRAMRAFSAFRADGVIDKACKSTPAARRLRDVLLPFHDASRHYSARQALSSIAIYFMLRPGELSLYRFYHHQALFYTSTSELRGPSGDD